MRVHRSLPPHVGLGSGTQLALAVARALAELYDVESDARALAAPSAEESVPRSAPGRSTMAVSSSRAGGARTATTVVRSSRGCRFPPRGGASWPYLTALPASVGPGRPSVCAPARTARARRRTCRAHRPDGAAAALADADLAGFGRALSEVQEITGRWFASVQGGTFAPGAAVSWCGAWANGARQALARARGAPLSTALSRRRSHAPARRSCERCAAPVRDRVRKPIPL